MFKDGKIWVGSTADGKPAELLMKMANRHGLIAGATGSGKTVTLKGLAESFSAAGVPVFLADVRETLRACASRECRGIRSHHGCRQLEWRRMKDFFGAIR